MNKNRVFDLSQRTRDFSIRLIKFAKDLSRNIITIPIISQLVRSGTSIGANYCEADEAQSRKDFIHKISICKKESKETDYWFDILSVTLSNPNNDLKILQKEVKELSLIFVAIIRKTKENNELK
ncbi:four helix bundle protein [bacterium CG_4_10_14_0_2_um_filter_33_32]|nr:MAG: four helix bundle protein [bacterium CG10_big_fil_rev_8_21_14_0_10_33_18]PIU77131.1 MAG: four helix bundle protein [bacterium CG06_land_8_20_14_3_00_33_50]PIW81417.1 MAG: four helix bundle protein [bacterium CG_4_8_14_3_um_filter_33_28]PIY85313.1 MAG: four helix bundle protein [bacterium CG_4_10_14_0_8_um_filter_33_57]PIZ85992.1 MAG: four helix bundle protein [bacterium CG_4_10_14_0_2_um_filter_33_32]PJA71979.1 MAG: four helix bundle protein [bacterium CG_4_9_14_3_um_filter_33_26]